MANERSATGMLNQLAKLGHIRPAHQELDVWAVPGALRRVPSITAYRTPDAPAQTGAPFNAELEQRHSGDRVTPGDA